MPVHIYYRTRKVIGSKVFPPVKRTQGRPEGLARDMLEHTSGVVITIVLTSQLS